MPALNVHILHQKALADNTNDFLSFSQKHNINHLFVYLKGWSICSGSPMSIIFVPAPALVIIPLTCFGVKFCASSIITHCFTIDLPLINAIASVLIIFYQTVHQFYLLIPFRWNIFIFIIVNKHF